MALTDMARGRGRAGAATGGCCAAARRRTRPTTRLRAGPARLCRQERLPGRRAGPVGRHRFGALRGHGGRRAGRGARALRHAALSLHLAARAWTDAAACAEALGVRYDIVPIERAGRRLSEGAGAGVRRHASRASPRRTCRAACAASILMAISNKFGAMVVTTGNKSEMSVGYATLYGDMNGGFNPIKDLYKMEVYRLARWRNATCRRAPGAGGEVIPRASSPRRRRPNCARTRPTRIRCRPTRCSTTSSKAWSSRRCRVADIVARGHDEATGEAGRAPALPRRIQAPAGRAGREDHPASNFGRDRRYPITNRLPRPAARRA